MRRRAVKDTINGMQTQLSVTMMESAPLHSQFERRMFDERLDEEERMYLREKALVERMTARRLFADDDY